MTDHESRIRCRRLRFAVISLVVLLVMTGSSCATRKVQTVTEETEANRILDVLLANGLSATKRESGDGEKRVFEIHLAGGEEEFRAAIQLMDDHCLPQPVPAQVESSGLVSSLEVEKARELRRIKINIESQLRNFPGATCVDVNLVQPEDKSLSLNPYTASATVLIRYQGEKFGLDTNQVARMVAGGVPGLSADRVFVTLTRSPLRPLPEFDRGRTLTRILWVVGIGFTTILLFVALAWIIRNRFAVDQPIVSEDYVKKRADDALLPGEKESEEKPAAQIEAETEEDRA